MSGKGCKRVAIGARPPADPNAEAWIRQGDANAVQKGELYTARLTLDVTPELLRALLEREFPEEGA